MWNEKSVGHGETKFSPLETSRETPFLQFFPHALFDPRAHVNRVKAAEGADVAAECPEEPAEPATDGASNVLAGLLLLPLLVVHHL